MLVDGKFCNFKVRFQNKHMEKQVIKTQNAPEPIGPYSQAILCGGLLYISGQIALKPGTTEIIINDITEETNQVMKNLQAILAEAKMDFSNVIKTTIYLSDMALFGQVNNIYGKYFDNSNKMFPARETVAVKELPRNANVEISMIAAL